MARIKFTSALTRFFPDLSELEVDGTTVREIVENIDCEFPGISGYLLEEDGSLRKHVNIFLGEDLVSDREALSDKVSGTDEIFIYQALSGG